MLCCSSTSLEGFATEGARDEEGRSQDNPPIPLIPDCSLSSLKTEYPHGAVCHRPVPPQVCFFVLSHQALPPFLGIGSLSYLSLTAPALRMTIAADLHVPETILLTCWPGVAWPPLCQRSCWHHPSATHFQGDILVDRPCHCRSPSSLYDLRGRQLTL